MSILSHKNLQFNKDWAVNELNNLTTKRVKLKYNNVFVNMRIQFNYI